MARTKGSQNINKAWVRNQLQERNFDPIQKMIDVGMRAEEQSNDPDLLAVCKELAQYAYPKLKAVEHSADSESGPMFIIQGLNVPTQDKRTDAEADLSA